jgi:ribose transport system permease protein
VTDTTQAQRIDDSSPRGSRALRIRGDLLQRGALFGAFALLLLVCSVTFPAFASLDNFRNILTFSAILFIIALGQTLVVLGRGVDLSVGSMVGLAGAVFARLVVSGFQIPLAIALTLLLAILLGGVVNGMLITKARISFFIVTLGTFSLFRSQAQVQLGGESLTVRSPFLSELANGRLGPIPNVVLFATVLFLVVLFVQQGTVYGRSLYATGANPLAARLIGIRTDRVRIISYAICALLAAVAGLLTVGQIGSAQPSAGTGLDLSALAAVLLGGTRFSGGHGGVGPTLLGVLFIATLNNALAIAGVDSFWQGTAAGIVLIAAVAIDRSRGED